MNEPLGTANENSIGEPTHGGALAIRSTPQDLPEGIPHEGTSERAPLQAGENASCCAWKLRARIWFDYGHKQGKNLVRQGDMTDALGKKSGWALRPGGNLGQEFGGQWRKKWQESGWTKRPGGGPGHEFC